MTQKVTILCIALVAALAISASLSSVALAQGVLTNTEATELTAAQRDEGGTNTAAGLQTFQTTSGSVTCDEVHATVAGLTSNSSLTQLTAEAIEYHNTGSTKCLGPFSTTPTIEFNGCHYTLTVGATISEMEVKGTARIQCPQAAGKQQQITISAPFCQFHVREQNHLVSEVTYGTVTGTLNDVQARVSVTEIEYQGTELCSSGTAGKYVGTVTVVGFRGTPHELAQLTSIEVH